MTLPTKVTLAYSATATNTTVAKLAATLGSVSLVQFEEPLFFMGLALESDSVGTLGSVATRTIVFNVGPLAGLPNAPKFFNLPGNPPPKGAALAIYSSSDADFFVSNPLILHATGAETVSVTYVDSTGHLFTTTVNLQGRIPQLIPLAPGSVDFAGGIRDAHITTVGSDGTSVGQLTISVITIPATGHLPVVGDPDVDEPGDVKDATQVLLGTPVTILPNGYINFDPAFAGATLRGYFQQTLAKNIAAPVTAAAPAFS
jgi:hypothetical protein